MRTRLDTRLAVLKEELKRKMFEAGWEAAERAHALVRFERYNFRLPKGAEVSAHHTFKHVPGGWRTSPKGDYE